MELEPLSIEEVRNYLQYRTAAAGLVGPLPFAAPMIQSIHQSSQGVPAQINRLAKQYLVNHVPSKSTDNHSQSLYAQYQRKIVGALAIVASLIGISWFLGQNSQVPTNPLAKHTNTVQYAQNQSLQNESSSHVTESENSVNSAHIANSVPADETNETTTAAPIVAAAVPSSAAQIAIKQTNAMVSAPTDAVQINVKPYYNIQNGPSVNSASAKIAKNALIPSTKTKLAPVNKISAVPTQIRVTNTDINLQMLNRSIGASTSNQSIIKKNNGARSSHQKTKKAANAKFLAAATAFVSTSKTVLAQPGSQYTIQILALSSELAVKKFIRANSLEHKARYFTTKRKGRTLYVLIYGQYPDKASAALAKQRLPVALQKYSSYPRSFSDVQAEIHKIDS